MFGLFDVDAAGECNLLARITFCLYNDQRINCACWSRSAYSHAILVVPEAARSEWRVMANLLTNESRLSHLVVPRRKKELAEKGMKGFLDAICLVPASVLLAFQACQKPSLNQQCSFGRIGL